MFGSNQKGVHGRGAAQDALKNHGAVWHKGTGLAGNSYAIPTKDWYIKTLPLDKINNYVNQFLQFAIAHPEMKFFVTRLGCGLAGYRDEDIAPLFRGYPSNCRMPPEWLPFL